MFLPELVKYHELHIINTVAIAIKAIPFSRVASYGSTVI